jgi:ABC-type xylose transport system permease subunit
VAGLVVLLARSIGIKAVASTLVKDESVRPAVRTVASIATGMLTEIAVATIVIGVVVVIAAWFAGPSRFAVRLRRAIAPHLIRHPGGTYAVVAAALLLVFIWQPIPATGAPIGMIVFTVLAGLGTEVLRRQLRTEFGDAPADPAGPDNGQQLAQLTALHDAGALTPEELDAAKSRLAEREPAGP